MRIWALKYIIFWVYDYFDFFSNVTDHAAENVWHFKHWYHKFEEKSLNLFMVYLYIICAYIIQCSVQGD